MVESSRVTDSNVPNVEQTGEASREAHWPYKWWKIYNRMSISRILDKSNSRCLEQICWSLDSSRYRELTVYQIPPT